jgi:hypothetical protein
LTPQSLIVPGALSFQARRVVPVASYRNTPVSTLGLTAKLPEVRKWISAAPVSVNWYQSCSAAARLAVIWVPAVRV